MPGNVSYNGYMATRELLRAIERAGSTNNVKIIKELENLKMSAADRMQHFDAYIDPVTHQVQQTIYLARRNAKPADNTDLFEIISWTEPKAALTTRRRASASSTPYEQVPTVELLIGQHAPGPAPAAAAAHCLHPEHEIACCSICCRISSTASRSGCCSR